MRVAVRAFNILSVCTGAGMLEEGVRLAVPAARTICMVEREAFAAALLAARMEAGCLDECPIWSNLETFRGEPWHGLVDCVCAGLPCQPYSDAGKRRGHADERAIWPAFLRLLADVQPALVFLENVPGFVRFFRPVGEAISALGYRFEAGLFSAEEVGASHRRLRFFCLAHLPGQRLEELGEHDGGPTGRLGLPRWGYAGGRDSKVAIAECGSQQRRGDSGELPSPAGGVEGQEDQRQREDAPRLCSHGREQPRSGSGRGVCETGSPVEHASRPGSQDRRVGEDEGRPGPRDGHRELGDSEQPGSQGHRPAEPERGHEPCRADADWPVFAPSPGDPRWADIIAAAPWLAPAVEPGFRVLADGLALVVDESRVDQLQAGGNGVVALCAAKAFVVLAERLGL